MIRWKQLAQAALGVDAAPIYTAKPGTYAAVHAASASNPTDAPVTVEAWIAGADGGIARRVAAVVVPAGETRPVADLINHKLEPDMTLSAAGAGVELTVSGAENVPE
ncbi:hypothetical protein [Burkholderia cenocepacia]|uniref:hypothetical protein n=1 Tax=Burkholderia cenocepacia TaxID=95486 RepID=UPI002238BB47|nr:hypothetical protein [Burkholderia cenocepacia]MCW5141060.1 hypothetical protein [Burkholderia cenocepacia]